MCYCILLLIYATVFNPPIQWWHVIWFFALAIVSIADFVSFQKTNLDFFSYSLFLTFLLESILSFLLLILTLYFLKNQVCSWSCLFNLSVLLFDSWAPEFLFSSFYSFYFFIEFLILLIRYFSSLLFCLFSWFLKLS
jgi:hypothetical protein